MKKVNLYPLKFEGIYKSKIWGGNRIAAYKNISLDKEDIGESWEISPMDGDISVVANGEMKGKKLTTLVDELGEDLLGVEVIKRFGHTFPLLIKMIDAHQDLSVQVHPADEYAKKNLNSFGKTEMWYLLDCEKDAKIYMGWKKKTDAEQIKTLVQSAEVMEYLKVNEAQPGAVFFIPAGRVHTIGKGNLLLEIQQASDVTFRLYDFDRTDAQGNRRELHVDQASAVLDYEVTDKATQPYDPTAEDKLETIVTCDYFKTSLLNMTRTFELPLDKRHSFTVLFCAEGEVELRGKYGTLEMKQGESVLLPAGINETIIALRSNEAKVVDCYVPHVK